MKKEKDGICIGICEFEKTGRLPKIAYKERVNFTIDADLVRKFRIYCQKNSMKMSSKIEQLLREELKKDS